MPSDQDFEDLHKRLESAAEFTGSSASFNSYNEVNRLKRMVQELTVERDRLLFNLTCWRWMCARHDNGISGVLVIQAKDSNDHPMRLEDAVAQAMADERAAGL